MPDAQKPFISVIIPVYNIEDYIAECVDSILCQEYDDFEIVLVDDGSTDGSGAICDAYSAAHANIVTIHKDNGGLSDARNAGISKARGSHVMFVDGDDFVEKGSFAHIVDAWKEDVSADVIFFEIKKAYPGGGFANMGDGYLKERILGQSHGDVLRHIMALPKFPGSACAKLIKSQVIHENGMSFRKGVYSEDIDWSIKLFLKAKTFNYCGGGCYCYRQERVGSITHFISRHHIESLLFIIDKWLVAAESDEYAEYSGAIHAFLSYEYAVLMGNWARLLRKDREGGLALKGRVREYVWLLSKGLSRKTRFVYGVYRVLGFDLACRLLAAYIDRK
ncbi:MAG: glycosyltransferase [Clostridiales Family XIII bacterium]|jgi:glycosyltransferase involved in cell wall biosynthesis|nr:glycosyltransferase [Clostridiales Family XIII bacterium]